MKQFLPWILSLFLAGCFGGGALTPQDHFYRLPPINTAASQFNSVHLPGIAVAGFIADDLHRERTLLYSDSSAPLQLKRYHYHHWVTAPSQLLQEHLIRYLRHTNFAPQVVRADETQSQATIRGRIHRFERQIDQKQTRILVRLELSLTYKLGETIKTFSREYTRENSVNDTLLDSSVQAYALALEDIYHQFLTDTVSWLATTPATVDTTHRSPAALRQASP